MNKLLIAVSVVIFLLAFFMLQTLAAMYAVHKQSVCIERAKSLNAAHKFDTETFKCTVTTVDGSSFKF